MLSQISIEQLVPGMMVSKVLEQNGAVKIRKVGMIRSPEMVKGLKEMGVLLVEVDNEQSIGIETENEARVTNDDSISNSPMTPTQQLMHNDKVIADADRELSQHFHRSMFMPSVDTLPSKWHLYGKTSSTLVLLVLVGLLVGWNTAKLPNYISALSSSSASDVPASLASDSPPAVAQATSPEATIVPVPAVTSPVPSTSSAPAPDSEISQPSTSMSQTDDLDSAENMEEIQEPLVLGYQPEQAVDTDSLLDAENVQTNDEAETSPVEPISPELMARFNAAIAELDAEATTEPEALEKEYDDVPRIDQLNVALLSDMPSMTFSAHMYTSEAENRWVRVNGLRLIEGDFIDEDLQIINIEPQHIILSFKDNVFSMNALSDW